MSDIEFVRGYWWPKRIKPTSYDYAFKHVSEIDHAVKLCRPGGVAVQAGGNIGLWPLRMANSGKFVRVHTFEPQRVLFECLCENLRFQPPRITPYSYALGDAEFLCGIEKRSLASHRVVLGSDVKVRAIDSFMFDDVSFIQLDIEGYEQFALQGARWTIQKWRPIIQIELDGLGVKNGYKAKDEDTRAMLASWGYKQVHRVGHDSVFAPVE